MLLYDKKKAVTAILGAESPGVGVKSEDDGAGSALKVAAHELITAVSNKDADAVVSAFKAMFAACEVEPHAEYGDEED